MQSLRTKCLLVKVSIGKQSAYKQDKKISEEIENKFSVHGQAKVIKRLFKNNKLFADVQSAFNRVYTEYVNNSAEWNSAYRIIKGSEFTNMFKMVEDLTAKGQATLDKFMENYEDHVAEDIAKSNGLNKMEDYPTRDKMKDSFYVKWDCDNLSTAEDFRVVEGLDQSEVDKLVEMGVQRERENFKVPLKESWDRLFKVTNHLKSRLSEYQGQEGERLHKSLLTNVQECIECLRKLNITEDQDLENVMDELESEVLSSANIDRLKIIKSERDDVVNKVNDIVNRMSVFSAEKE